MLPRLTLLSSCTILTISALGIPAPTAVANRAVTLVQRDTVTTLAPTPSAGSDGYFTTTQHITVDGVTNEHVTLPGKTIDLALPTCIQTIAPDPNGYVPPGTCNALWAYYPNFSAAAAFAVMFAGLTAVHIWQAVAYRKPFCWVIVMASFWETGAFTFRAISSRFQQNVGIYLVFQIFVLLAPLWINAFDYMVLGRMIHLFHPSRSLFSVKAPTIAAIFVTLDFVSFIVQLVGGSSSSPSSPVEDQLRAIHIYMGGIGLQEFFIVVFLLLAAKFQMDVRAAERRGRVIKPGKHGWRALLYTLYASLGLITLRIMYRLIEFSQGAGTSNPLLTNETYFYVLEALPMFFALSSFVVIHPGSVLVGQESEMPGFFSTLKGMCFRKRKNKAFVKLDNGSDMALDPVGYDTLTHHT